MGAAMINLSSLLDSGHKVRVLYVADNIHSIVFEVTPAGGAPHFIQMMSDGFGRFIDYIYVEGCPVRRAFDPISILDMGVVADFLRRTAVSVNAIPRSSRLVFNPRQPARPSFQNIRVPMASCS